MKFHDFSSAGGRLSKCIGCGMVYEDFLSSPGNSQCAGLPVLTTVGIPPRIYLIGSLRQRTVQEAASALRAAGFDVFDDWYAAGELADDAWKSYEQNRGRSYVEALRGAAAVNVFQFDRKNILASDIVMLVLPAGKSGHLELGWALGKGKPGYILLDETDVRWDVMYQFADTVFNTVDEAVSSLVANHMGKST